MTIFQSKHRPRIFNEKLYILKKNNLKLENSQGSGGKKKKKDSPFCAFSNKKALIQILIDSDKKQSSFLVLHTLGNREVSKQWQKAIGINVLPRSGKLVQLAFFISEIS